MRTLLIVLSLVFAGQTEAYHYEVAACTVFQNEAPYLKEWIEYHRLIGVEHFYLANHQSTDNYLEVLAPYIEEGIVELFDLPYQYEGVSVWTKIQTKGLNMCLDRARKKAHWLCILDLDEFLVMYYANHLKQLLPMYAGYAGLVVNWQLFGTSHVTSIPEDRLLIETLTWKGEMNDVENLFIKSIVQPDRVKKVADPHFCIYKEQHFAVTAYEAPAHFSRSSYVIVDPICINHYWTRDETYLHTQKIPRRAKWQEGPDGVLARASKLNVTQDLTIQRFVPRLRERLFGK